MTYFRHFHEIYKILKEIYKGNNIKENYRNDKIIMLTTAPYEKLFHKCPHIDEVYVDRRSPRWNLYYLLKLKQTISGLKLVKIFDLQNSSRTSFYRKFLFRIQNWSSTETTLKKGENKKNFDKESVLNRFRIQLDNFNIKTNHTLNPDFSWVAG